MGSSDRSAGMRLRRATARDARFLFDLANDPLTRAMSFSTDPIPWDTHVAWLDRVLADSDRRLWVGELDGEPVAMGRLDAIDGQEVVSVALAPAHRGKGLAVHLVQALGQAARLPLVAEIKAENVPSIRAFEACGFTPDGPGRWVRSGDSDGDDLQRDAAV